MTDEADPVYQIDLELFPFPSYYYRIWKIIAQLFRRLWSQRTWILQEIASPASLFIDCGDCFFEWIGFENVWRMIDLAAD